MGIPHKVVKATSTTLSPLRYDFTLFSKIVWIRRSYTPDRGALIHGRMEHMLRPTLVDPDRANRLKPQNNRYFPVLAQKLSISNSTNPAESKKNCFPQIELTYPIYPISGPCFLGSSKTLHAWNFRTRPSHLLRILSSVQDIIAYATLPWGSLPATSRGVRGALNHYPVSTLERSPWICLGASCDALEGSDGRHQQFFSQVGIWILPPILAHFSRGQLRWAMRPPFFGPDLAAPSR
jgi:hypothetical protein